MHKTSPKRQGHFIKIAFLELAVEKPKNADSDKKPTSMKRYLTKTLSTSQTYMK